MVYPAAMNNPVALILFGIVLVVLIVDVVVLDWELSIFLMQQLLRLTQWVAFWR